jgi:hypothetical protein
MGTTGYTGIELTGNRITIGSDTILEAVRFSMDGRHNASVTSSLVGVIEFTAGATMTKGQVVQRHSSSGFIAADESTTTIAGVLAANVASAAKGKLIVQGLAECVADTKVDPCKTVKSATAGKVCQVIDSSNAGATVNADAVSGNYGNQPEDDAIEVLSSVEEADVNKTVTIYGTTHGGTVIVSETIALDDTDARVVVESVKQNWGTILAIVSNDAHAGTLTVRKKTGAGTIGTLATGTASSGIKAVAAANVRGFNAIPTCVASGASTKICGLVGTGINGAALMQAAQLNGATPVAFGTAFRTITHVLVGDVETARQVTIKVSATEDKDNRIVGKTISGADEGENILVVK